MNSFKLICNLALIVLGVAVLGYGIMIIYNGVNFSLAKHSHESQDLNGVVIFVLIGVSTIGYGFFNIWNNLPQKKSNNFKGED